jgi:hypothetical protein
MPKRDAIGKLERDYDSMSLNELRDELVSMFRRGEDEPDGTSTLGQAHGLLRRMAALHFPNGDFVNAMEKIEIRDGDKRPWRS